MDYVTCSDLYQIPCDGTLAKDHEGYYFHANNNPSRNNHYHNPEMEIDFMYSGLPKCTSQDQKSRQVIIEFNWCI